MNNDTFVRTDEWLSKMIDVAELQPDIGLVNPRFDVKVKADSKKPFIEIDFCRGYCILIKRAVIDRIGVLDEAYGLGYYDDDDYSVRAIRAGFRCVRANGVHVEHLRDSTFKAIFKEEKRIELHEKNKALFYSRWGRRLHIVFIITNPEGRDSLKELLFSLARKQHILHVWNTTTPLGVEHTNIREKIFPQFLNMLTLSLGLYRSRMRKESKRYALVFTDDKKLSDILSRTRWNVNFFDSLKGGDHVCRIVDAAAGAEKLEEMKV